MKKEERTHDALIDHLKNQIASLEDKAKLEKNVNEAISTEARESKEVVATLIEEQRKDSEARSKEAGRAMEQLAEENRGVVTALKEATSDALRENKVLEEKLKLEDTMLGDCKMALEQMTKKYNELRSSNSNGNGNNTPTTVRRKLRVSTTTPLLAAISPCPNKYREAGYADWVAGWFEVITELSMNERFLALGDCGGFAKVMEAEDGFELHC